jgi:hypothetical protein
MNNLQTGRLLGCLLLLQFVSGVAVNFVLTAPLFSDGGFVVNGAAHSTQIGVSAVLALLLGVLGLLVAALLYKPLAVSIPVHALLLVMMSVAGFALSGVEQIAVLSLVSFSELYQQAAAEQQALLIQLKSIVAETRNWSHYVALIGGGMTVLLMHAALLRSRLVPLPLAAFGVLAALSQISGVSLPLLASEVNFMLLAPLALAQLLLAAYLIWRGLADE